MKTDKFVKKLGAGAKNNTDCRSFSYGNSIPRYKSHGIFLYSLVYPSSKQKISLDIKMLTLENNYLKISYMLAEIISVTISRAGVKYR